MIPLPSPQPRSDEEVAAGALTLTFGGRPYRVPVLVIEDNEQWVASFAAAVQSSASDLSGVESIEEASRFIAGKTRLIVDLLAAYDTTGRLGGTEWLVKHATAGEVYEALREVLRAAFPFGDDLERWVPGLRRMLVTTMMQAASSQPTSSAPPSTAGRRRRSGAR